jgi:hypothetical protein
MKVKFIAVILGTFFATTTAIFWPIPFIGGIRDTPPKYLDKDKQEFIARFIHTFESGNPYTEDFDQESFEIKSNAKRYEDAQTKYYREFKLVLKAIAPNNCPIKKLVIDSKYQNDDARAREFIVFDIEKCKSPK